MFARLMCALVRFGARKGLADAPPEGIRWGVKTRSSEPAAGRSDRPLPEEAVNCEKRRNLLRMAKQFLRVRRIDSVPHRFDIVAIDSRPGTRPQVRLHKGAFRGET